MDICSIANHSLARDLRHYRKRNNVIETLKKPTFLWNRLKCNLAGVNHFVDKNLTQYKVSKTHFRTIYMCGDCTPETWAPLPSLCSNTCYMFLNTYLIVIICWEIPKQEKKTFWLQKCLLKNDRLKQVVLCNHFLP